MEQNIQVQTTRFDLIDSNSMLNLGNQLAHFIKEKRLSQNIQGREYVNVEGWQFAGGMLGILPIIKEVTDLSSAEDEIRFQASCDLLNIQTGAIVGGAVALCSNKEKGKKFFEPYAIQSMAQTRSIGKAYRLMIGWLMKAAGYEATPAEEMDSVKEQEALLHGAVVEFIKGTSREEIDATWKKYPQFRKEEVFKTAAKAMSGLYPKEAEIKPSDEGKPETTQSPVKAESAQPAQAVVAKTPTVEALRVEYLKILNHPLIERTEKTKRLLKINKLNEQQLQEEIDTLSAAIAGRDFEATPQITYRNEEEIA